MIDRDTIVEFIEARKKMMLILTAAILVVLVLLLILSIVTESRLAKNKNEGRSKVQSTMLLPENLWLPAEPLSVPGVQLSRERRAIWSAEDVKRWYTVPDNTSLAGLRSAGQKQIEKLLESVP